MSSVRNSLRALAAAALLATATAAAADILVVRSTGPSKKSFPPGKRLPENARITLKTLDELVVLDGRGTRTIRGPGTFTAGVPQTRTASSAPAPGPRIARIGAVRGPGESEQRPPSIWHVDVSRSSNICLGEPAKVTLWRAESAEAANLEVVRIRDGSSRKLEWESGASTLAWPDDLAVADGDQFRLSWTPATPPTLLTFRILPAKPAGLEDMASSLIRNECTAQLDLLIETVRLPEDLPAG